VLPPSHPPAFFTAFASPRSSIASIFSGKFKPQFTPIPDPGHPNPGHTYTTRAGDSKISSPLGSGIFTCAPGDSGCSVSM
jgi:hypothetical protein